MAEQLLSIPGEITKITTLAHNSMRLQIDSQENVLPELVSQIFQMTDKVGYFCFLPEERPIAAEEVIDLPQIKLDDDEVKTPSQRLRGVIYLYAKQRKEADTELFYRRCMEKFIKNIKEKLL